MPGKQATIDQGGLYWLDVPYTSDQWESGEVVVVGCRLNKHLCSLTGRRIRSHTYIYIDNIFVVVCNLLQ